MTLSTDINLPLAKDYKDEQNPDAYTNDLVFELQNMYQRVSNNVNGTFRNYADVDSSQWIPTIDGSSSTGATTYTSQIGWVWRQGIMTEVWADITWTATTATGNLFINLPYEVTRSNQMPFCGCVQTSNFTYTSGDNCSINAIPSTLRGEIWNYSSGGATANQLVVNAGRIIFHLRYIGVSDE